jgi:glycerol-3-phosphate dehydrogenase (NAD(P)+)
MPGQHEKISILGAGSWGATLAGLFAGAGHAVYIWTRSQDKAAQINNNHYIEKPIAVKFPPAVQATDQLEEATRQARIIVFCCPSQSVRSLAEHVKSVTTGKSDQPPVLLSAVKGLELSTHKRMSEVLSEVLAGSPVAALSGPNLAGEILSGLPAAAVVGCQTAEIGVWLQSVLTAPTLRLYSNVDLIGVELGGTLKNIIAIAAGVSDGLKLGANAKAALLTRGLAEITRLAVRLGAKPLTMSGLAGMGDLLATAAGPASRNYILGMELAKGRSTDEIIKELGVAVEGVPTTEAVCELSKRLGLELPIAQQVEDTLKGRSSPAQAIMTLMSRPLSAE